MAWPRPKILNLQMQKLSFLIILAVALSSCEKTKTPQSSAVQAQTLIDVSYGTDGKQKMDLYLPANRDTTNTKILIIIHGGGWNEGDKTDFTGYITQLQQSLPDYAFANLNYRLASLVNGSNKFPTQENDVKFAVEFLLNKSKEYKFSKKMAFLGASAGAHLALLQSYKYSNIVKPKAVVSFFGPSDLIELYNKAGHPSIPTLLEAVTGTDPQQGAAIYQQSSPINFINTQSAPTLILQGGLDVLVPENQAVLLKNKLSANNVPHQYVFYPNESHGWVGANMLDSFSKIVAFLQLHVK